MATNTVSSFGWKGLLTNLQWTQVLLLLCLCFRVQLLSIWKRNFIFASFIFWKKKKTWSITTTSFLWNEMQLFFWCVRCSFFFFLSACVQSLHQTEVVSSDPARLLSKRFCCVCVSSMWCLCRSSAGGAANMSQKVNVSFWCVVGVAVGGGPSVKARGCTSFRHPEDLSELHQQELSEKTWRPLQSVCVMTCPWYYLF